MFNMTNRLSSLRRSYWSFLSYVACMILTVFVYEVYLREVTFGRIARSYMHPNISQTGNQIEVHQEGLNSSGITRVPEREPQESGVALQSDVVTEASRQVKKATERTYKIDGDLVGYIWPKPGSLDDRIMNQMQFMKKYAAIRGGNFTTKKIILRVGNFNFGDLHWKDGQERLIEDKCPIKDCIYSSDRSQAKVADALLISQFDRGSLQFYTPKPAHQIWITQHLESPHHNRLDPSSLSNLVNWTVSFRQESTIVLPYATWKLQKASDNQNLSEINYAKGKTKKVAWFVSNCADRNGRLGYGKELKKHIDVDIYGACGTLSCPRFQTSVDCKAMLKKDYKFYLGFENSNCIGYITEKIHWNGLAQDLIPIVMGARPQDYAAAAPPGSYIHVDDFESPRHLAEYLKVLDSNDTLYNEYFKYKQHWRIVDIHDTLYWCRLCALLHLKDDVKYVHWYEDYNKWWNGACYSRQDGSNPWRTWRPQGYWKNGSRDANVKDLVDMPS